jgi:transposase
MKQRRCLSSAIRWVARWRRTGSVAAKPMGGKRSPLDAHKDWLLELVAAEPDLTLQEIRGRLRARGIIVAASSVWRFCDRHDLTFKKKACTPPNRSAKTSAPPARTGSKSSRGLIRRSSSSSTRPALQPT